MPSITPLGGVIAFAVTLLGGDAALHVAARYVVFRDRHGALTFEHAAVTALLGAVVWALLSLVPVVGVLLALAGWVAVIGWRCPGTRLDAVKLGISAWAAALVILAVVEVAGTHTLSALGIPGV